MTKTATEETERLKRIWEREAPTYDRRMGFFVSSLLEAIDEQRLAAALVVRGELTDKAWRGTVGSRCATSGVWTSTRRFCC